MNSFTVTAVDKNRKLRANGVHHFGKDIDGAAAGFGGASSVV